VKGRVKMLITLLLGVLFIALEQDPGVSNADIKITPTDKELVVALSSNDSEMATEALEKIFQKGESMVPLLVSCQGNRNLYWGYKLGDRNSANLIYFPDKEGAAATHVTIEVTALYLLEAIFRKDIGFADSPFLYDHSMSHKQALNSEAAIARAWSSVNDWLILVNRKGMDYLRKKKINPLFKSKASFWGS
jgi:hypothetical protein